MSKSDTPRALDRDEAEMVQQSQALDDRSPAELRELIGRLRARRDRAQRQIRTRARSAQYVRQKQITLKISLQLRYLQMKAFLSKKNRHQLPNFYMVR